MNNRLELNYQFHDTEVAESMSTLLEVQVICDGCESHQWSRDGQPLLDRAGFSGVSSNILYNTKPFTSEKRCRDD